MKKKLPPLGGRKWRAIRNFAGVLFLLALFWLNFGRVTYDPAKAAQAQARYNFLPEGEVLAVIEASGMDRYVVEREPDGAVRVTEVSRIGNYGLPTPYPIWNNAIYTEESSGVRKDGYLLFEAEWINWGSIYVLDPGEKIEDHCPFSDVEHVGNNVYWLSNRFGVISY